MEIIQPAATATILDLGATSDATSIEANFFEQWYPHKDRITCAAVENAAHLEQRYPGVTVKQIVPNEPLPFRDGQFDVVFSNAVVEHAGSRQRQRFFIAEAVRVTRRFFITTPNRWFPVEMHTALPFLHYLPQMLHRRALKTMQLSYWASEEHLNLLDARSLQRLFAPEHGVAIERVRLAGMVSNLIAYGPTGARR